MKQGAPNKGIPRRSQSPPSTLHSPSHSPSPAPGPPSRSSQSDRATFCSSCRTAFLSRAGRSDSCTAWDRICPA